MNFIKKISEEAEASIKGLTDLTSSRPNTPTPDTVPLNDFLTTDTIEIPLLQKQVKELRELLKREKVERISVYEENIKLKKSNKQLQNDALESKQAKQTNEAQVKSKMESMEKELHQLRLKAKFKISQLQKENDALRRNAPPMDVSLENSLNLTEESFTPLVTPLSTTVVSVPNSNNSCTTNDSNTNTNTNTNENENQKMETQNQQVKEFQDKITNLELELKNKKEIIDKLNQDISNLANANQVSTHNIDQEQQKETLKKEKNESRESLLLKLEQHEASLKKDELIKKRLNELNFSLEEQAQDLRIQLNHKVNEINSLQEAFAARNQETEKNEERLKKMKGLLIAANNKITEYKEQISLHHQQLEEANSKTLSALSEQEEFKLKISQQQTSLDQLLAQINDEKHETSLNVDELNRQLKESQKQLESTKAEFQSYKAKAHAALLQNASLNLETKVNELQESILVLQQKLIQKQSLVDELQNSVKVFEESESVKNQELSKQGSQLDTLQKQVLLLQEELQSTQNQLEKQELDYSQKAQKLDTCHQLVIQELQQGQEEKNIELQTTIQSQLKQLFSLDRQVESLNNECDSLKTELNLIKSEKDTSPLPRSNSMWVGAGSPINPISPLTNIHSMTNANSQYTNSQFPNTNINTNTKELQNVDLLSYSNNSNTWNTMTAGTEPSMSSFKVKELLLQNEQLVQLLTDSESHVQKLIEQELLLKEELKSQDRQELRQNLNLEYLKNIVLSFFESGSSREKLIPVVSKVLCLSPQEEKRLRDAQGASTFGFF